MLTTLGVQQFWRSPLFRVSDRSNNCATLSKPDTNFGDDRVSFNPGEYGCASERSRLVLREYVGVPFATLGW